MTAFYIRTYMDCNCEKLLNKLCNVRSIFNGLPTIRIMYGEPMVNVFT